MNQFPSKNYFTMPNEIFSLGLDASEIAVYAYLRCLENRSSYQCWPSYTTIGNAVGRAKNTVMRYVDALAEKGLIYTPTSHGRCRMKPHRPWAASWRRSCKQKKGAKIPERRQSLLSGASCSISCRM